MTRADRVIGLLLIGLAAWYYWLSGDIEVGLASDRLGPRFFPRGLAVLLGAASFLLILRTFGPRARTGAPVQSAEGERSDRLVATLLLSAAYLLLLPRVGFLLLTPVYLAAFTWLLGYRRWAPLLGTAVGVTMALYLVFARALRVRLPPGLLDG